MPFGFNGPHWASDMLDAAGVPQPPPLNEKEKTVYDYAVVGAVFKSSRDSYKGHYYEIMRRTAQYAICRRLVVPKPKGFERGRGIDRWENFLEPEGVAIHKFKIDRLGKGNFSDGRGERYAMDKKATDYFENGF
jgi:hypothetical protein